MTYTTTSGDGFAAFLAILFSVLWIAMIIVFIRMAINVGKIRRMMEYDRGAPAPPPGSAGTS